MPKTYLVPHVGCPTFEAVELPGDTVSQGLIEVVELQDPASRSQLCESILRELPECVRHRGVRARGGRPDDVRRRGQGTARARAPRGEGGRGLRHGRPTRTTSAAASEPRSSPPPRTTSGREASSTSRSSLRTRRSARGFFEARGFVPLDELHDVVVLVKRL